MLCAMNRLIAVLVVLALSLAGVSLAIGTGAGVPILTGPKPFNGKGFGQVKPRTIFLGGDPTGLVCRIQWLSWGGEFAVGTGVGWYVNSHESVAEGHAAPAIVVLYRLGTWEGHRAHKFWSWYYPGNGSGFGHITPVQRVGPKSPTVTAG
jgi:hypothetical protein